MKFSMRTIRIILFLAFAIFLAGCRLSTPTRANPTASKVVATKVVPTSIKPVDTATPKPTEIPPTSTPFVMGPDMERIPPGYNPLTGLFVTDASLLDLPAVLISITNFPPSARPQAGLSFAPWVFELYISEGMTRFLSVFYGDYPGDQISETGTDASIPTAEAGTPSGNSGEPKKNKLTFGPIRSGRLPYAAIRDFFKGSCLVYAGATVEIRDRLRGCAMVYGSDEDDINSAMVETSKLKDLAKANFQQGDSFNYSGNQFSQVPPAGGQPATQMDIFYSLLNQGQWVFSDDAEAYLKNEDLADGTGIFRPMVDRINGKQLAFSNVVVLFAEHTVINPYIIDVGIWSGQRGKAVIFRDGQRYDAVWSTMNGDYEKTTGKRRPMRFEDAQGNPFPLKPGQTWIHIFTPYSYIEDKGDGLWLLRFMAPAGTK